MRSTESIKAGLDRKRARLDKYYERETEMLDRDGVKSYAMGTRNLSRYDTSLKDIQEAIKRLEQEIADLEAILSGGSPRRAVGVVPRDW